MNFKQGIQSAPFTIIVIPYIFGIIFSINFVEHSYNNLFFITIILLSIFIYFINIYLSSKYHYRWVFGLVMFILLFFIGFIRLQQKRTKASDFDINKAKYFIAIINEEPIEKNKSIKSIVKIIAKKDSLDWQSTVFKAIIYFEKINSSKKLKYGDRISFANNLKQVSTPNNPKEFDYKKYLANKNIHFNAYLQTRNWIKLKGNDANPIFKYSYQIRNYALNLYKKYGITGNEFAVLSALTLGYKEELDDQIKQAYSSTGAMHVLAVSGLHVGIIFVILNNLLFFKKFKQGRIIKAIVIIFFLWAFAFISGLSISVVRASLMFSLAIIGTAINKNASIYNTISLSAFILLIHNPLVITDVGFQLSYLAVTSIVYLHPQIYAWFDINDWTLDKIWSITAVSIAAQIGTAPIQMYYFHQFPTYFFLSNIIVIPAAFIIMYTSLFFLLISGIEIIAYVIAYILNWIVWFLNYLIFGLEMLPYSKISDISFDLNQTLILFIIFALLIVYLQRNKIAFLKASIIVLTIFIGISSLKKVKLIETKSIYIYNVKKSSIFNIIDNDNNILFADKESIDNKKMIRYAAYNNWLFLKAKNVRNIYTDNLFKQGDTSLYLNKNIFYRNNFLNYYNKKFLFVNNDDLLHFKSNCKMKVDYVVLMNNTKVILDELSELIDFKEIIFDSSNGYKQIKYWKKECEKRKIKYFSVPDMGAFSLVIGN